MVEAARGKPLLFAGDDVFTAQIATQPDLYYHQVWITVRQPGASTQQGTSSLSWFDRSGAVLGTMPILLYALTGTMGILRAPSGAYVDGNSLSIDGNSSSFRIGIVGSLRYIQASIPFTLVAGNPIRAAMAVYSHPEIIPWA